MRASIISLLLLATVWPILISPQWLRKGPC
jgi:hypothetical protein